MSLPHPITGIHRLVPDTFSRFFIEDVRPLRRLDASVKHKTITKEGFIVMAKKHTARCACGYVHFEFDTDPEFIATCHCLDCKKSGGGEASVFFAVPEEDLIITSGEVKPFHYTADSGKGLDRNFCPTCGARLFTSNLGAFPGLVFVTLASLDDPTGIEPKLEMYVKRRLPWQKAMNVPQWEAMPG